MNKKQIAVFTVLIIGFLSLVPVVQSDEVKIITNPVTDQIYMITGKGGNLGLFIGEDGTFLIDDQFAPLTEKIVAAIKSAGDTKIIAGHGPLGNKAGLATYRQMLETAYDRLRKLKAQGKSAKEAAAAKPLADLEATWGNGIFKGDRWIEIIYSGV